MTPDVALAPRQLAGYRVLRALARDDDAEVLLGFRETDDGAADGGSDPVHVALKVMAATPEGWRALGAAMEALSRARGAHVVAAHDLDSSDGQLCLVLERLPRGSLAELLGRRSALDAGEVVTILAPLAGAIQRMHAAGVAHGALGARAVLFRDDGAPVLIAFGGASLFPPGSVEVVLERQPGVLADRRAIVELAGLLLTRVVGSRARAAAAILTEMTNCPPDAVVPLLTTRLFELAAAMPVRFTVDEAETETSTRRVPVVDSPAETPPPATAAGMQRLGSALAKLVPEALVQRTIDVVDGSPLATAVAAVTSRWRSWTSGRRRVTLGLAAGSIALVTIVALVPSGSDSALAGAASSPRPTPSAPATLPGDPAGEANTILSDDPVAAAAALRVARERCLRSLSLRCLDDVDQPGSSALHEDRMAITQARQGGELPSPLLAAAATAPSLVEHLGDVALVQFGVPANPAAGSFLLVRSEAGWRIRVVIAPPGGS